MDNSLGFELYRNIAENRDVFEPGARDVDVYDLSGNHVGTIPIVPDFSAFADTYGGASGGLAGGQTWLIECEHIGNARNINFGHHQGTGSTPVHQSYTEVKRVAPGSDNYVDMGLHRINKVVTDAVHWELATDPAITDSVAGMKETVVWRSGAGTQIVFDENGNWVRNYGAYTYVTAGILTPTAITHQQALLDNGRGEKMLINAVVLRTSALAYAPDSNPVPLAGHSGDSGSPVIIYNPETQSFQYYGNHYASTVPKTWESIPHMLHSDEYFSFVINSSEKYFNTTENSWTISAADENGIVTFTGNLLGESTTVRALRQGERGDTSTVGIQASKDEMWESLDWVLASDRADLHFTGDVNTGAGAINFRRGENSSEINPAYYSLSSSDPSVNFQTAGYIIQEHVYVHSTLTGREGDEWRIVGENGRMSEEIGYDIFGGFFELAGTGNNNVDLNLGVGVTVYLNREGGYAAKRVQLNTGSTVIMADSQQIAGDVLFGAQGGTLDINGNDFARTSANLYTFNDDATIMNGANSEATFTYTVVGEEQGLLKSAFYDSASLTEGATGVLNIDVNSAEGSLAGVHFSNSIEIAGNITITATDTIISGRQLEIANEDLLSVLPTYTPSYDPTRWVTSTVSFNEMNVTGSDLTFGEAAHVTAQRVNISADSTLTMRNLSSYTGEMNIGGQARFDNGSSVSGEVNLSTGARLDMLSGGSHDADINIATGATMDAAHFTTLKGTVTNHGTINLDGKITLGHSIVNEGTINFSENIAIDISLLHAAQNGAASSHHIYTGSGDSAIFTMLDSNNVIGAGSEMHIWDFMADGSIVARNPLRELGYSSATLALANNVGGFAGGESFADGTAIHFTGTDTQVTLSEAGLSAERIYVDNTHVNLISNGNVLDVERLVLSSGASLTLTGDALSARTRIAQQNAATDMTVTLDMEGATIANKDWTEFYTGNVNIRDGAYDFGTAKPLAAMVNIEQDGKAILRGIEYQATNVQGQGVLSMQGIDTLYLDNIDNFHGMVETSATSIHFQKTTNAGIYLESDATIYFESIHPFSDNPITIAGPIVGDGSMQLAEMGTTVMLSDLTQYTGAITTAFRSELILTGEANLGALNLKSGTVLTLQDGAHIVNDSRVVRKANHFTIDLGEGSHLEERNLHIHLGGGTSTITGSGLHTVIGLGLSHMQLADILNIGGDATLHIIGTDGHYDTSGTGSFQLSTWHPTNTINIDGTLISEAGASSKNGNAIINIRDGGSLILKKGGIFRVETHKASYINIAGGGTLVLGVQENTLDYGHKDRAGRLEVTMRDGSNLAAFGSGDIDIYHSVYAAKANDKAYLHVAADQHVLMHGEMNGLHAHIIGGGTASLYNDAEFNELTIEVPHLNLGQSTVTVGGFNIATQVQLESVAASGTSIAAQSMSFAAGQSQLNLGNGIERISIGSSASYLSNRGSMSISGVAANAGGISTEQWSHVNVSNADIAGFSSAGMNNVSISNAEITGSNFHVNGGHNSISNANFDAQSTLFVGSGSSMDMTNVNFLSDFAIAVGGEASFSGNNSVAGTISNDGILHINNQLSLGNSILNSGSLVFDANVTIDISQLQSEVIEQGSLYRVFFGLGSESFGSLDISNIIGLDSNTEWTILSSGIILSSDAVIGGGIDDLSYSGGTLYLADIASGFDGGKYFRNGSSINFVNGDTDMTLAQDNLHVVNMLVDGVHLSIYGNGERHLSVDNLNVVSGSTLEIVKDSLAADVVIQQVDGARDINVILDMQAGTYQNRSWLDTYTGNLELRNGVFDMGYQAASFQLMTVASDAHLVLRQTEAVDYAITGTGLIDAQQEGRAEISQLSNFTGRIISSASTIALGGQATIEGITTKSGSTLELLAGAQIKNNSTEVRRGHNTTIDVGAGAHFDESGRQLLITGGSFTVSGEGTYTVKGLGLSATWISDTLNILEDATLHLIGTNDNYTSGAGGTFQLSTWSRTNTINIDGTLISEAGASSKNGNAIINIRDGGSLILKKGGIFSVETHKASYINVESGGTLVLGAQGNKADYGHKNRAGRLEVTMSDGSHLAAYGSGDIDIYHTVYAEAENARAYIHADADQNVHMRGELASLHAHLIGAGSVSLYNNATPSHLTVEVPEVNLGQASVEFASLNVATNTQLDSVAEAGTSVTAQALNFQANQSQLQVGAGISHISLGSAANSISRNGNLSIAARGGQAGSMSAENWNHVSLSNIAVNGFSSTALDSVEMNHAQITASHLQVNAGSNSFSNTSFDAQSSLSIAAGAELSLLGNNVLSGSIINAGTLDINGHIVLSQSISNTGTLVFADSVILDLSQITGEVTANGTLYHIFSGASSDSFTLLGLDNLTGLEDLANEALSWTFQSDGSILSSIETIIGDLRFRGGSLNLAQNVGGFDSGASFTNGSSIHFSTAATTMRLDEANLHVANLLVDATSLSIDSNGHQLAVDNLSINSGATLELVGEALAADVVISQVDGVRDTQVILDMQGGNIADKNWLDGYTGDLRLRDGSLDIGNAAPAYQSLHLEADSSITMRNASAVASSISGSGSITIDQASVAELSALNGFTGSISANSSTLRLGGTADLSSISWGSNGTLEIMDGAQISASSQLGYRWGTNYSINVGAGAHFDESATQLRINGGTVNLSGSGTYSIMGMGLSASNQVSTVNIDAGLTVHIVGTNNSNTSSANGSFQVSTWSRTNTINIAGTLISEAGISSRDGNANINILDGGLLELKVGPRFNSNTAKTSTIHVNDGGTLALGNQTDTTDYGDQSRAGRLDIRLNDGATLTTSGTEDVTIHHTLLSSDNANVNVATKAGQQLNIASALGDMHLHATGEGSLHIQNTGAAKNITVSNAALELSQQHVQLDSLQLSNAQASVSLDSAESLSVGSAEMRHHNGSKMNITYKGGGTASISQNSISNVNISNTHLSGAQNVSISNVAMDNSYITQSTLEISSGSTLVSNSIIGEGSQFILNTGAELEIINSHFESYSSSTFQLAEGLNLNMQDYLTLRNVSMDAQVDILSSSFGTMAVSNYQIAGVDTLADQASIEGKLYVDMSGLADLSLTDSMFLISFETTISTYEDIFNQLVFRSGDLQLDLNKGVDMRDGTYLFFSSRIENTGLMAQSVSSMSTAAISYSIVPEPSTATLSLLALSGLLLRRRRKAS